VDDLLLRWFVENGRDLPWRRTRDPYSILVSEVMLQQTTRGPFLAQPCGLGSPIPSTECVTWPGGCSPDVRAARPAVDGDAEDCLRPGEAAQPDVWKLVREFARVRRPIARSTFGSAPLLTRISDHGRALCLQVRPLQRSFLEAPNTA
jgi:hypothetical protein